MASNPETNLPAVQPLKLSQALAEAIGPFETPHPDALNCVIHEEDNDPPDVMNAVRIARAGLDEYRLLAAAPQPGGTGDE